MPLLYSHWAMSQDLNHALTRIVLLATRWFRYHVVAFVLGNLALWGLNRLTSETWWAFWPLFAWSLLLALHYFLLRGFHADEGWVEARVRRLRAKSYDHDHIRRIEASYRNGTMPGAHDLNWRPSVEDDRPADKDE